ncbi:MAG: hypothetical protein ABSG46_07855 [Candidatus Binataceae bacterium]
MMRKFTTLFVAALCLGVLALTPPARAAEPRPWLCRDKPVISNDKPMTWEAENHGGGSWVLTFLRFDPDSGHDGFTVVSTEDIAGHAEGSLDTGQWYAVGLYRVGGHWICAAPATESHQYVPGVVRDLCYGEDEGDCQVKLTVHDVSANH